MALGPVRGGPLSRVIGLLLDDFDEDKIHVMNLLIGGQERHRLGHRASNGKFYRALRFIVGRRTCPLNTN